MSVETHIMIKTLCVFHIGKIFVLESNWWLLLYKIWMFTFTLGNIISYNHTTHVSGVKYI